MPRAFARSGPVATLRRALVNHGVGGLLRKAMSRLRRGPRATAPAFVLDSLADAGAVHPFDREHGVDTSGVIPQEALGVAHRNALWAVAYYGVAPSVFDGLMAEVLDVEDLDPSTFTFVDLGSGKGRALMLASRWPFREILGIELSPDLHRAAEANLSRFSPPWRRCAAARSVEGDATTVQFPSTPLVVFVYNPFLPPVLTACLRNLQRSFESNPRDIVVLYVNPDYERAFARLPVFERRWQGDLGMSEEDARADRFGRAVESAIVFRTVSGPF